MERNAALQSLPNEIELLAKMHFLYGMFHTPAFEAQKEKIDRMIKENKINLNTDIDPISKYLYRRYV